MPDLATLDRIGALNKEGFPWTGNWRVDAANLGARGVSVFESQRLAQAYSQTREKGPMDLLLAPIDAVGEVLQTLQKPIIGFSAAISQGRGFGEALTEALEAPFTVDRTFAEIPGMPSWLALGLDVFADPLFMVGGHLKFIGKGGKAYRNIQGAALDVATQKVLVGAGRPAASLEEALSKGLTHIDDGVDIGKWKSRIEESRKVLTEKLGKDWPLDRLVSGPRGEMIPTEDLVRAGVAAPFTVMGKAPLLGLQAAGVRALDASPWADKIKLRWLLGLDREVDMVRRSAGLAIAASTARQALGLQVGKEFVEKIAAIAEKANLGPEDIDPARVIQILETKGIFTSGGRKIWSDGGENLEELAQLQQALRDAVTSPLGAKLKKITNPIEAAKTRKAIQEKAHESKFAEVLGLLVNRVPEVEAKHAAGELLDVPAFRIEIGDAAKLGIHPIALKQWGRATRQKRIEHFESVLQGDHQAAVRAVRTEIEGSIEELTRVAFGLKKDDPLLEIARAYEEFFTRIGSEEVAAGALAALKKGYVERAAQPFAQLLMNKETKGIEPILALSRTGWRRSSSSPLSPASSAQKSRKTGKLTRIEVEDMARRGELDVVGSKPIGPEFENFKARLNPEAAGPIGKLMSHVVDEDVLRRIEGADDEFSKFYWSNPMMIAANRWNKFARVINARNFLNHSLEVFSTSTITKKSESLAKWGKDVRKELDRLQARGAKYEVFLDRRMIPDELWETMKGTMDEIPTAGNVKLVRATRDLLANFPVQGRKMPGEFKAHIIERELASEIIKRQERFQDPVLHQGFVKVYGDLTGIWKRWALFPRPSYHFRNFVSNNWLMVQAGMKPVDLIRYNAKAVGLMRGALGTTLGFGEKVAKEGGDVIATGARATSMKAANAKMEQRLGQVILKTPNGDLTVGDVMLAAINDGIVDTGLFASEAATSLIRQAAKMKEYNIRKGLGSAVDTVRYENTSTLGKWTMGTARQIEGMSRLALYLWELDRGASQAAAASSVFKHLFNYSDMSMLGKTIQRNFVPFFSWMRHNVPRQLQALVERPGITTAPLRVANSHRARNQISEDLEPHWMSTELGFPHRLKRDPKTGRQMVEFRFFGSYMPIRDLTSIGLALTSAFATGGKLVGGLLPGAMPEWVEEFYQKWEQRGSSKEIVRWIASNVNPLMTKPLELASGVSFFRMRELNQVGFGDTVEVPWLGNYETTKETATMLALAPLWQELQRTFSPTDALGREKTIGERLSRTLTGMEGLLTEGDPGGRYEVDVALARQRMERKVQTEYYEARRALRDKIQTGKLTPTAETNLMRRIKLLAERRGEVWRGGPRP